MSDSADYVEEAKARDQRFAILANSIAVESDMRDNPTIKSLLDQVNIDSYRAMEELADTSPTDTDAVSKLLVRVSLLVYIRNTLNAVKMRGQVAEHQIRAQDRMTDEGE